jgi:hypothetical protein
LTSSFTASKYSLPWISREPNVGGTASVAWTGAKNRSAHYLFFFLRCSGSASLEPFPKAMQAFATRSLVSGPSASALRTDKVDVPINIVQSRNWLLVLCNTRLASTPIPMAPPQSGQCVLAVLVGITIDSVQTHKKMVLDRETIVTELEAQRDSLERAIAALRGNRITFRKASSKPDGRKRPHAAATKRKLRRATSGPMPLSNASLERRCHGQRYRVGAESVFGTRSSPVRMCRKALLEGFPIRNC